MTVRIRLAALSRRLLGWRRARAGQTTPPPRPPAPQTPTFTRQRRVRRGGRRRHRSRRPVRPRSHAGATSRSSRTASRRRSPTFSLVDIPVERLQRPLVRPSADRARRQEQRAAVRRPRLRHGHRRSPHGLRPHAARAGGGAAVHPAASRRQRSDGGRPHRRTRRMRARSSPATSGCCWRPSIGRSGRKLDSATRDADRRALPGREPRARSRAIR